MSLIGIGILIAFVSVIIGTYDNSGEELIEKKIESSKLNVNEYEKQITRIQYRVTDNEEMLKQAYLNGESLSLLDTDVAVYVDSIVECEGKCISKYMTYEEAKALASEDRTSSLITGVPSAYEIWLENNKYKFEEE